MRPSLTATVLRPPSLSTPNRLQHPKQPHVPSRSSQASGPLDMRSYLPSPHPATPPARKERRTNCCTCQVPIRPRRPYSEPPTHSPRAHLAMPCNSCTFPLLHQPQTPPPQATHPLLQSTRAYTRFQFCCSFFSGKGSVPVLPLLVLLPRPRPCCSCSCLALGLTYKWAQSQQLVNAIRKCHPRPRSSSHHGVTVACIHTRHAAGLHGTHGSQQARRAGWLRPWDGRKGCRWR